MALITDQWNQYFLTNVSQSLSLIAPNVSFPNKKPYLQKQAEGCDSSSFENTTQQPAFSFVLRMFCITFSIGALGQNRKVISGQKISALKVQIFPGTYNPRILLICSLTKNIFIKWKRKLLVSTTTTLKNHQQRQHQNNHHHLGKV